MIRVVNKRGHQSSVDDVYIGRPSIWGNPFVIGKDGNRRDVIAKYEAWLRNRPDLMEQLPRLRGRTLVCFCAPAACHGDVLKRLCEASHTPTSTNTGDGDGR